MHKCGTISLGGSMKRSMIVILFVLLIGIILSIILFNHFKDKEIPIDNENYTLISDLNIEVYSNVKVSDMIDTINGKIYEDNIIDTNELGIKEIEFIYENKKGRKRRGIFNVTVIDTTAPIIFLNNSYSVTVGYNKNLTDVILSLDNYSSIIKREIIGNYDFNKVGSYPLQYKATDGVGNETIVDFTLNVNPKTKTTYSNSYIKYSDIASTHKTDNTKIGLDVSKWQGNIDFNKLKQSGVEFIIIRVGTGLGFGKEYVEDAYFRQNIKGALDANIPVGVYFYSYATTNEEAKNEARWVYNIIKDYDITLPVVFDWESWSSFNSLNLSIHDINEIADSFLDEISSLGYKGMLYGSKNYLQKIWDTDYPVWLAHYTKQTNYEGDYDIWQLCDNGRVSGINGYVDINVMYEN